MYKVTVEKNNKAGYLLIIGKDEGMFVGKIVWSNESIFVLDFKINRN